MSSQQSNSDTKVHVAGIVIVALITAVSTLFSSWFSYNQASKSSYRTSMLQQKNICLERFDKKEELLQKHASAFLGGIGAYDNVLSQTGFYAQDNNLLVENLSLISLEGMKVIAYSSDELTDITFKIIKLSRSVYSKESQSSVLERLDTLKKEWVAQYQKDISKIKDDKKICSLPN